MRKKWKSLTSVQWFKALETWKPIQIRCLRSQEGDEMIISAWIALESVFSVWLFLRKFKFRSWLFCAASRSWAWGFACVCIGEWFRSRIWSKESRNWLCNIWFSSHYFAIFFTCFCYQIMTNSIDSFYIWLGTKSWRYYMHKKIWNIRFNIFHVF